MPKIDCTDCDKIAEECSKLVYTWEYTPGVRERLWGANAAPHATPSDIFTGNTHVNGDPDIDIIVADLTDNTVNSGANTDQAIWDAYIYNTVPGAMIQDVNTNTGELNKIFMGAGCCPPTVQFEGAGTPGSAGPFYTMENIGWYKIIFQQSDSTATGGIQIQTNNSGPSAFSNFTGAMAADKPVLVCREESCDYVLQDMEFDCPQSLAAECEPVDIKAADDNGNFTITPLVDGNGGVQYTLEHTNSDGVTTQSGIIDVPAFPVIIDNGGFTGIAAFDINGTVTHTLTHRNSDGTTQTYDIVIPPNLPTTVDGEYRCEDDELDIVVDGVTKTIDMSCIKCCEEVTRAQLLALRNAGNLDSKCTYAIPYSRGCLVDTVIHMTPICADKLSHDVDIETTWDNELWEGRYSIDSNRMLEVHDNLGNKVGGQIGNEVDRFPWGVSTVNNNNLYNSDVYIDCDTTQTITHNTWESRAYTDLRGFEGVFNENTITSYGRVYLNGATTVDFRRNQIQSYAYVYFNGGIDDIFIRQNTIADNSYVRKFTTATGRFTLIDSLIARGDVRHYNGIMYMNSVDVLSTGRIYDRNLGTLDMRYVTVSDISYLDLRHQGVDDVTRIWYSSFKSFSNFAIRNTVTDGTHYWYRHNQDSSTVDIRTSTADFTVQYQKHDSNGYMIMQNCTGTFTLTQNSFANRAQLSINGADDFQILDNRFESRAQCNLTNIITGNLSVLNRNTFDSYAIVAVTETPGSFRMDHCTFSNSCRLNFTRNTKSIDLDSSSFINATDVDVNDQPVISIVRTHMGDQRVLVTDTDSDLIITGCSLFNSTIIVTRGQLITTFINLNMESDSNITITDFALTVRDTSMTSSSQIQRTIRDGGAVGFVIRDCNFTAGSSVFDPANMTSCDIAITDINADNHDMTNCSIRGSNFVTLTAVNTNRYVDYGTLGLI